MTITTQTTAQTDTVTRRARIGMLGAALWALLPVTWGAVSLEDTDFGSAAFVAVAASYWFFAVVPPVLLIVGHLALRDALGRAAGQVGRIGIGLASAGLGAMALGNGIEVASLSAGSGTVAVGHGIFLVGFLVSIVGGLLVGITVIRRRRDSASRTAGRLLALALPLGFAIGTLGSLVWPDNDGWFFAAITLPTALAWLLLGRSLAAGTSTAS